MKKQQLIARIAAGAIALCVAALLIDFVAARVRNTGDEKRILAMQEKGRMDASSAPKLAAEQDRITRQRRARKTRTGWLSYALLAAAAVFLTAAKWGARGRKPVALITVQKMKSNFAVNGHIVLRETNGAPPEEGDWSFVDEIVRREGTGKEAAIPILQAIQEHYRYLPDEALRRVCELTEITPAQIAGTSSFYARFRHSPRGEHVVRLCHGTACHVSGARQIGEELRRRLDIPEGSDTDPQRKFTVEEVACLGCCSLAPVLMVDDQTSGKLTPPAACQALGIRAEQKPC